jgi:biopolymer transport protein ExbD
MVDLGFLLITFFIFTTTMSQPRAMRLIMPKDTDKDPNEVGISAVLTILLGKNDQVYYYERNDPAKLRMTDFRGIRDVILDKKRKTDPVYFEIILKPSRKASYKNTVDLLDEMTIDAISHYALVDISPYEFTIIRSMEH